MPMRYHCCRLPKRWPTPKDPALMWTPIMTCQPFPKVLIARLYQFAVEYFFCCFVWSSSSIANCRSHTNCWRVDSSNICTSCSSSDICRNSWVRRWNQWWHQSKRPPWVTTMPTIEVCDFWRSLQALSQSLSCLLASPLPWRGTSMFHWQLHSLCDLRGN